MVVLKGIDKGDIVISDAPQISKEGSLGQNSTGSSQPRRAQLSNKEDVPHSESLNDLMGGHETYSDGFSHERKTISRVSSKLEMMQEHIMYPDNKSKAEAISRKLVLEGNTLNSGTPWRPPSLLEQLNIVDWRDASGDFSLRDADMVWNQLQKDSENSQERWFEAGFLKLICKFSCQMRQRTHPFYCLVMPCLICDPRQGHHLVLL